MQDFNFHVFRIERLMLFQLFSLKTQTKNNNNKENTLKKCRKLLVENVCFVVGASITSSA